jgi:hypothetical protein
MHENMCEARRPRTPASQAPMLRMEGRVLGTGDVPVVFHLPLPPVAGAGARAVHAVERRAKKAYFAVLDAMRTGIVDADRSAQLARLAGEVRTGRSENTASEALDQLVWLMGAIAAGVIGAPLLPKLSEPLVALVVGVTVTSASASALAPRSAEALAEVLRWPLEWLQTRGVIVTQGLEVRCTLQS